MEFIKRLAIHPASTIPCKAIANRQPLVAPGLSVPTLVVVDDSHMESLVRNQSRIRTFFQRTSMDFLWTSREDEYWRWKKSYPESFQYLSKGRGMETSLVLSNIRPLWMSKGSPRKVALENFMLAFIRVGRRKCNREIQSTSACSGPLCFLVVSQN